MARGRVEIDLLLAFLLLLNDLDELLGEVAQQGLDLLLALLHSFGRSCDGGRRNEVETRNARGDVGEGLAHARERLLVAVALLVDDLLPKQQLFCKDRK